MDYDGVVAESTARMVEDGELDKRVARSAMPAGMASWGGRF